MQKRRLLITWFISILLLMSGFSKATENYGEEKGCKNLGKVTDIDNLLYQFYSNLDTQCLFKMPSKKLEEIWGVRILDFTSVAKDKRDLLLDESRRIFTEENGFFILKDNYDNNIPAFLIRLTKEYLFENGWGGSIGRGEYPQLLPKPQIVSDFYDPPYEVESIMHSYQIHRPPQTIYQ